MAVQAFITAEDYESEQAASRTLKQPGPTPIFFSIKIFFSVTGFQLFRVLFPKTAVCMNHGTLLRVLIQTTGKGLQKRQRKEMVAALWS